MSGNRGELIEKISFCMELGRIPKCPKCFGGWPKFDTKTCKYYCKGYYDDDHFHWCKSDFKFEEITRETWE